MRDGWSAGETKVEKSGVIGLEVQYVMAEDENGVEA